MRGRPRGVRRARPSSVTVCHSMEEEDGGDDCGCRREDQMEESGTVVVTPVALWVPSTPAEMGDSTVDVSLSLGALLFLF